LGLTILEAMASGRPVVSTACGGPSTTVLDGETGRLVPVGDAEALADAMLEVLSAPERSDAMGGAGRERVEEYFSMEATGQRFLDTYAQLLDNSSL
jgi:glycosyltransferase involved in cell wall biosynthesis